MNSVRVKLLRDWIILFLTFLSVILSPIIILICYFLEREVIFIHFAVFSFISCLFLSIGFYVTMRKRDSIVTYEKVTTVGFGDIKRSDIKGIKRNGLTTIIFTDKSISGKLVYLCTNSKHDKILAILNKK